MWRLVGAPLDSSGEDRGEADAPAALRAAGLAASGSIEDLGDLPARINDTVRDPTTGVIGFAQLVEATQAIADAVQKLVSGPGRPLVVGGDCSLLPGVFAGLRGAGIAAGLWMVDGHPDALDGETSPTGEAADMDLSFLVGRAPSDLAAIWGGEALVAPERVALLGHRAAEVGPDVERELALVPEAVLQLDAAEIAAIGPELAAERAIERLAGTPAWLHVDLDAVDESEFPAVSYPQPGGLAWDVFERLVGRLALSESLLGVSVADLEPSRDPDGRHTQRVAALIAGLPD